MKDKNKRIAKIARKIMDLDEMAAKGKNVEFYEDEIQKICESLSPEEMQAVNDFIFENF